MALLASLAWLALGIAVPLEGTVEDAAGRPIPGASVWLGDTIATRQGPEVLATTLTDERGRFRLERPDDLAGRGITWSPTLWAYRQGYHVAFIEFKGSLPKEGEPVRLVLGPAASTSLRVVQADGQPAQGARVRLVDVNLKAPRPPDGMLAHLAVTTDADGRCTLDGFTPAEIFALDVTAKGQLVQCLPVDPDAGTVTLRPLGWLKARIIADDPKAVRGWSITAWSRPNEPGYRGPYRTHWVRETTGDDGLVAFPPIAEGQVDWEINAPEGSNYLVAKPPRAAIRAGETEAVEIKVVRAVQVEGTVVEEPGGAPVPGVKIQLDSLTHSSGRVNFIVTDIQGNFSTLVLPGQARFSFSEMPGAFFLPPSIPHWADLEVKEGAERQTFTPPRLRRAAQVRGRVIDEAGKPAAGVYVTGSWTSAEFGSNPISNRAETDARGEFTLGNIAPKSEVKLTAASGLIAESDAVTVATAGAGEPITLVLKKRPTLALSGRVFGPDGRPLADATIQVKVRPTDQPFNSGTEFAFEGSKDVRTGRDGCYKTPEQIPVGYEYRIAARAPGYEPGESGWVVSPTVVVGDLTLRRLVGRRAVAGRVVDSTGKPVTGAEVFQSGDGPKKTRSTTDSEGRFRVPDVPTAPAFLFIAKEGWHFLGRRVDPSDRSVDFTLHRLDEPPLVPLRLVAAAVPRDEERAIARALLAEARRASVGNHSTQWMRIAEITALVDPDRVLEMIENQALAAGPGLLTAIAITRFEDDPRKALEILDAIEPPDTSATVALNLFDRLAAMASPGFRRELLERAARQAREIKDPGQAARVLARAADRRLDLGDTDLGSGLVREALVLAEKPRPESFPYPGDDLAPVLARIDLPAALKLLKGRGGQPFQLELMRTGIVNRIASTDPSAARRILSMIEENRQPEARRVACLRMAAKNLAAARALAAEDHDPMVEALLPAIAARDMAGSDPESARVLLREAVERLGKLGESHAVGPPPSVVLARLLPLAIRIDPDRAPDYLWLALSRRPPLSALPVSNHVRNRKQVVAQYSDLARLAAHVARHDRAAAEAVFVPVAERLASLDDQQFGLENEGSAIFRAAGAFDARVARTLLDSLPEDPSPPENPPTAMPRYRQQSKAQARIALAEILGLPPGLRLPEPFLPESEGWFGNFED